MRKVAIFLLLVCVLAVGGFAHPVDWIPRDTGFALYIGNGSTLNPGLSAWIMDRLPFDERFVEKENGYLLILGSLKFQESLLDLLEMDFDGDLEEMILAISQQPVAIITNLVPAGSLSQTLYEALEYVLSDYETESGNIFSIEPFQGVRFPIRSISDYPPMMADIFLLEIEDQTVFCTDEDLLIEVVNAYKNPQDRLNAVSDFSAASLAAVGSDQIVYYCPCFPLSVLAIRALGFQWGYPGALSVTVNLTRDFVVQGSMEMVYQTDRTKARYLAENLALQSFITAPYFEGYSVFSRSRPRLFSLSLFQEFAEDILGDLLPYDLLMSLDIEELEVPMAISGLFKNHAQGSSFWANIDEERFTLLLDTDDTKNTIAYFGYLMGLPVTEEEDGYYLSEYDSYGYAEKTGSIVEISNDSEEAAAFYPKYLNAGTLETVRPEWAEKLRRYPDGLLLSFFYEDFLAVLSGFCENCHLQFSIDLNATTLIRMAERQKSQEVFDGIVNAYEDIFYYIYDRVYQTEDGIVDLSLLVEEAPYILDDPAWLDFFEVKMEETENAVRYTISYTPSLPNNYGFEELREALDWLVTYYEARFEVLEERPVFVYEVPEE